MRLYILVNYKHSLLLECSHIESLFSRCFLALCFEREPLYLKPVPHLLHLNLWSNPCTVPICSSKLSCLLKNLPHSWHSKFAVVLQWYLWCLARLGPLVNFLLHLLHLMPSLPCLAILWAFKRALSRNFSSQSEHVNFNWSLSWLISVCLRSPLDVWYVFPQM